MAAILNGGELMLSGLVGLDWFGDFFTYSDVVLCLAQVDDASDLTVRLNTPGGVASEGAAIHALLSQREGQTTVVVEGVAVSAGSLIAMAGDTVTMAAGSVMMIHDPAADTSGTSADHAKTVEWLEALATSYARVYAAKSGKTADACREIMKAETWFTPEQAMAAGFADKAGEERAKPATAFDYRTYSHAPKRLTALAKKNGWSHDAIGSTAAVAAQPGQQQEQSMTDKERADALAAELAELKKNQPDTAKMVSDAVKADRERRGAIMALDEAKGREKLAERLSSTTMSIEDVKATLADAPKATAETPQQTDAQMHEQHRLNGEGLGGNRPQGGGRFATAKSDVLLATMKKQLGVKEGN